MEGRLCFCSGVCVHVCVPRALLMCCHEDITSKESLFSGFIFNAWVIIIRNLR